MSEETFKPAWWLRNPHLQTLWPTLCRPAIKNLPLQHERFELPDGDFVDLNWVGAGTGPIVLLLHGFEGSIESHYAKGMLQVIKQNGWRGVFMHFRGCSGEPNRLPKSYHSGETGDVHTVMAALRQREPDTRFAAVGFSLGGNVLLKWLGETGNDNFLSAAVAVSVPFELHNSATRIGQGFSQLYQWYFLKCLRDRLEDKFQKVPPQINYPPLSELRTIKDFDDKITAPLHGFNGVHDYYNKSSSRQYLKNIRVPTLLLNAKDDPFMTEDVIPRPQELSPAVKLEVTEAGGHVGFVAGNFPWRPEYWLEKRVPRFLQENLL